MIPDHGNRRILVSKITRRTTISSHSVNPGEKGTEVGVQRREMMTECIRLTASMILTLLIFGACGQSAEEAEEAYTPKIDPARFVGQVDNEFFPLIPGTNFVY